MNKRLFPRMAFCLTLITSFLFMPFSAVYADGYNQNTEFWRWWYIEHQTDAITEGQGASAENIADTDSGQTAGTVIYNQSGVTRGELIDYVEEQYNQAEGYLQNGVEYYVDAVNNVYDSTVTAGTKAAYQTEKAVREVVDSTGKVIVDVSGSDFWHSVYNGLFNNNGYKNIYVNGNSDTINGTVNGHSISISFAGYVYNGTQITASQQVVDKVNEVVSNSVFVFDNSTTIQSTGRLNAYDYITFNLTVDGISCLISNVNAYTLPTFISGEITDNLYIYLYNEVVYAGYSRDVTQQIVFKNNIENVTTGGSPVLQPKQCGFIIYNGNRVPVYTDPSQNPFTINDDGTVDYNGTKYPIYVEPDNISPDGWLKILEYIDNQDQTENPYNPQGQPWNTQPDGSVLGGFFSNLIKDISSIFDGIGNAISNLIDKVIKAIKDIANIIIDALKQFWTLLIGDVEDYATLFETDVNDNFDMISDLYELLLECMGVDA